MLKLKYNIRINKHLLPHTDWTHNGSALKSHLNGNGILASTVYSEIKTFEAKNAIFHFMFQHGKPLFTSIFVENECWMNDVASK